MAERSSASSVATGGQRRPALRQLAAVQSAASADYRRARQQLEKITTERQFRAWQQEHRRRGEFLASSALFLLSELSIDQQIAEYQLINFFLQLNAAYSYLLGAGSWSGLNWQILPGEISIS